MGDRERVVGDRFGETGAHDDPDEISSTPACAIATAAGRRVASDAPPQRDAAREPKALP